jgi:hypothetical protein
MSSTCLFPFSKKPFLISWKKKELLLFPQVTTTVLHFHHNNNHVLSICHTFPLSQDAFRLSQSLHLRGQCLYWVSAELVIKACSLLQLRSVP